MDVDQLDLNPRITAAVKKAKLRSARELLCLSGADLQRLTGLSAPDARRTLQAAALHLRGSEVLTALQLSQQMQTPGQPQRLSLGCPVLDGLLRGGLPLDGISELAGHSSVGKTQLALQLCLTVQLPRQHGGLEAGAVYICTEEVFPHRRLQQLIAHQPQLRDNIPAELLRAVPFGDRVFVEHAADVDALLECVARRLPVLLGRGLARLVVLDSVAAPFRCAFGGQASVARARRLQTLGAALRRLSCTFQSPVLCTNQIMDAVEDRALAGPQGFTDERACAALGMAWCNQLLLRLAAERTRSEESPLGPPARTLRVVFAPHLPPASCSFTVSAEGVRGTESC
ncbi:DNA repair protein XRCC3 [Echinops telfairi]|uniref:DNA repair protein XRCC3 n=1 Tax=Echinops telfairi TaxID=9371 RepID=A0ABM1VJA8_ECHTE|nr:DNA repair protein XRCC3 [Echinops telfairi]